jgi:hypothetical protein
MLTVPAVCTVSLEFGATVSKGMETADEQREMPSMPADSHD